MLAVVILSKQGCTDGQLRGHKKLAIFFGRNCHLSLRKAVKIILGNVEQVNDQLTKLAIGFDIMNLIVTTIIYLLHEGGLRSSPISANAFELRP